MFISGLQKLTLLDYPGTVACTVFTAGCNFRCPFCHNAPLVLPEMLREDFTEDDVLSFLKKRRGVLDGVAITGGEPLMHGRIDDFLKRVRELGFSVKLDTNGSFPEHLARVVEAGLVDRVAMDIKNSPQLYGVTVGLDGFDISKVEQSKSFLMEAHVDYEFRTTVVKGLHTKESLADAAQWIAGAKEYYLQQFKNSGNVIKIDGLSAFDESEMHDLADTVREYVPSVQLRGI